MVAILSGLALGPVSSPAADDSPANQQALMDLGRDFATRIGSDLRTSALYLSGAGKLELAEQRARTIIPEGEPLLLRMLAGPERIPMGLDIYAIKKSGTLMISLGDFFGATGVPIKVKPSDGTASGWFIRQNQTFAFDAKKNTAVIAGQSVTVDPAKVDTETDENHIFVSADTLEKWFSLSFDYDFSALNLLVTSLQPFPAEEAYRRSQKIGNGRGSSDEGAKLPYYDQDYSLLTQPYIDTNVSFNVIHTPGNGPIKNETVSTIFRGDLAGFNAKGYLTGSARQPSAQKPFLDSARITLGKEDADGRLLGPLKATAYSFGDVNTAASSLIGGGEQEVGVSVTSNPLDGTTTQTFTQIKGDSQPGWDIELYRNESFIDIRHVDSTGRYDFGNVDLTVGDNDFKLLFFGPQGEAREEHRHIGVNSNTLASNKGYYEASLTRNKRVTWEREPPEGPGIGDPHLTARYEYGLGNIGTVNAGLRTNNDEGEYRTFTQAGIASYFLDTFLNADVGVDTGTGAYGTILTVRRNLGSQALLLQYLRNSRSYNISSPTAGAFIKNTYRASLNGPVTDKFLFLNRLNYNLSGSYTERYNDTTQISLSGSATTRVRSVLFSAGLNYNKVITPAVGGNIGNFVGGSGAGTTTATLNARGSFYGGVWRLGAQYDIKPKTQMESATLDYSRQLTPNLDSTTEIAYSPEPKIASVKTSLNWQTRFATISPRVAYDSLHNATAGVDVHYALGADPFSHKYQIYNAYLSESGGVAARIFQDKNGNGVFDAGDELLPDVQLTAIQGQRSAVSDKSGVAFIPDLEKNRLTDIVVNPSSSENAYGISLFEGVSVRPHPGTVISLEFPIVDSGELDGQADFLGAKGSRVAAANLKLSLIAPNGRVEKTASAASDGYWSISTIRPGIYYLVAETDDSTQGYFIPRRMEFKPDGSTYFGQGVSLAPGQAVFFRFTSLNPPPDGPRHARVIVPGDIQKQETQLALGPFHSRLAMTFAWYKLKLHNGSWVNNFDLVTPVAQIAADPKTNLMEFLLKPRVVMTMAQSAAACQALNEPKLDCTVDVITTYRNSPVPPPLEKPAAAVVVKAVPEKSPETVSAGDVSVAVARDAKAQAVIQPVPEKPKNQTVFLNLGTYNSRELMTVIWYKLKTRYGRDIGDAYLLVKPMQSQPDSQTGQYVLRAALPAYNPDDAKSRCRALNARKQACSVEILPARAQLTDAGSIPKG